MTYNQDHNDVNRNNSIDLNELYNLNRCIGGNCVSNATPQSFMNPSLEELAADSSLNIIREQDKQTAANETAFLDSSPISGYPEQMYQPITKTQSEKYPTPAVVNEEIQNAQSREEQLPPADASDLFVPYRVTRESLQYLNGFIRTQIGRRVTIDFVIGSDTVTQKSGYLLAVAQNYLLINELDTNDVTACDLYTMKFIRFYY